MQELGRDRKHLYYVQESSHSGCYSQFLLEEIQSDNTENSTVVPKEFNMNHH